MMTDELDELLRRAVRSIAESFEQQEGARLSPETLAEIRSALTALFGFQKTLH